ncbi:MAG: fructosamine kinase family protein, partial [Conexibacter sp.]|nr:fructosamine kinase family protein [Conexibacter sp.]
MRVALSAALGEDVVALDPIAGGDLNAAFRATLAGGARVFVKTSPDAAPGAYAAEAAGLRWLAAAGALPVPEVLAVDADRWLA